MTNLINARNCSGSPVHLVPLPSFVSFLRISRWENIFTNQSDVFVCQRSLPPQLWYLIFGTLCIIAYYDCDYNCCSALPFFFFFLCEFYIGETFSPKLWKFWFGEMILIILKNILCSDFAFLALLFFLPFCEFSSETYFRKIAETLIP